MKPELSLRLQPFGDAVREKEVTVVLPRRDLDILIDVVETNLAELFVHGHYDRQELMALKRCRSELRAARQPLARTACATILSRRSPRGGPPQPLATEE